MAAAASAAGVIIVGGDTKVVEHGKARPDVHHHLRHRSSDSRLEHLAGGRALRR